MRVHRAIWRLLEPLIGRLSASDAVADPWARVDAALEGADFGAGSRHPWEWYFEGASAVKVTSPAEVADWLFGCEYVPDVDLFREEDYWQHPLTFEQLRRGDCEDYALWGWRKLVELGCDATLITGTFRRDAHLKRGHAWVVFEASDQCYLLDGTLRERGLVLRPFGAVHAEYVPHAGVNAQFQTWGYAGAALTATLRRQERHDRTHGDGPA